MLITITGKPCSGKSTVGKILEEKFGYRRIGVGDMFKAEAARRGMSAEEFPETIFNARSRSFIPPRIVSASFGPMPPTDFKLINNFFSALSAKPKRLISSSFTLRNVKRVFTSPTRHDSNVDIDT